MSEKRIPRLCFSARTQSKIGELACAENAVESYHNLLNLSNLNNNQLQALANLIPLLICGEESATFVFDDLANKLEGKLSVALIQDLRSITYDETQHARYLELLRQHMPAPADRSAVYRATKFLKILKTATPEYQLARLAALDSAVCKVLSALLRPTTPVSQTKEVADLLRRIQLDEARHVRVTRACMFALGLSSQQAMTEQFVVHNAFATLLKPATKDLNALQVDIASLIKLWENKGRLMGELTETKNANKKIMDSEMNAFV